MKDKLQKVTLKKLLLLAGILILLGIVTIIIQFLTVYNNVKEVKISTPSGQDVIFGRDIRIPKDVPENLPIYPNGKITSVIASDKDSVISIETKDDIKLVLDWHKNELIKNSWEITSENYFAVGNDTGNLWFENQKYTGQVTVSNRNHNNPEKPTEVVRINISVKSK